MNALVVYNVAMGLFGSSRSGVCTGTGLTVILILWLWLYGVHASLSLGPGGEFPGLYDLLFYALSHEEFTSLFHDVVLLLYLGPLQERKWGTFVFVTLSLLSTALLPPIYALFLFVTGDEASRICGYSGTLMALLAAQCRQARQRRVLHCLPFWSVPWLLLLLDLFLLPGAPGLLHFYAICLGLNYSSEFIEVLQKVKSPSLCACLPVWAYVPSAIRSASSYHLPSYATPTPRSQLSHVGVSATSRSQLEDHTHLQPWTHHTHGGHKEPVMETEAQLLEEQMLRAGILASLEDAPDGAGDKVEVAKSSVPSLRLQQLEKMGFPMEKAVVALAATPNLDGAISLLIEDQVGEEAVVISKGKKIPTT